MGELVRIDFAARAPSGHLRRENEQAGIPAAGRLASPLLAVQTFGARLDALLPAVPTRLSATLATIDAITTEALRSGHGGGGDP